MIIKKVNMLYKICQWLVRWLNPEDPNLTRQREAWIENYNKLHK